MKKVLVLLGALSGMAWGACVGPYCYDDTGAVVNAGLAISAQTATQIAGLVPASSGQMVVCTNCTNGGLSQTTTYNLCIASGTNQGAYVEVSSPTLKCK